MIELTCSNGEKYTFKNLKNAGDYILITFTNKDGKVLKYMVRVTNSLNLVMN